MKKLTEKQLLIILVVAAVLIALFIFRNDLRNLFSKKDEEPTATKTSGTGTSTGTSSSASSGASTPPPVVTVNPFIGKTVFAKFDNTKVYNKDMSVYKIAKAGEWIGPVEKQQDNGFLVLAGGLILVYKDAVKL